MTEQPGSSAETWFVYLLRCADGSLYTGIAKDVSRRCEQHNAGTASRYPSTTKPVFFGHYWLEAERPTILAENVACLDYSVAKGGFLCAYRWEGEQKLSNDHFVRVAARSS